MVVCNSRHIFVLDLDGTLISEKTSMEIYSKVYEETVKEMENRGNKIPTYLRKHGERWIEAFAIPSFKETFNKIYEKFIEVYDFTKEKRRVEKIISYIKSNPCLEEIYILSDNPYAGKISKMLGLGELKVLEINSKKKNPTKIEDYFKEYVRVKSHEILKIKESCNNCEITYVGDIPFDRMIAEITNVNYLDIKDIEKTLYLE